MILTWFAPTFGAIGFPIVSPSTDALALGSPFSHPIRPHSPSQRETLTGVNSFSLYVYAEYEAKERFLRESSSEELLSCIGECDPRCVPTPAAIRKVLTSLPCDRLTALARQVGQITTMPMVERPALEDWVHPNGRILAIGDAAHPIPVSRFHESYSRCQG